MKIKQISKEQYLVLAALEMPVYSCGRGMEERDILDSLLDDGDQRLEIANAHKYVQWCSEFWTLVEDSCA